MAFLAEASLTNKQIEQKTKLTVRHTSVPTKWVSPCELETFPRGPVGASFENYSEIENALTHFLRNDPRAKHIYPKVTLKPTRGVNERMQATVIALEFEYDGVIIVIQYALSLEFQWNIVQESFTNGRSTKRPRKSGESGGVKKAKKTLAFQVRKVARRTKAPSNPVVSNPPPQPARAPSNEEAVACLAIWKLQSATSICPIDK